MYKIVFSQFAQDDLQKMAISVRQRIVDKLTWYSKQDNIQPFSKKLSGNDYRYRLRIGHYRVIYYTEIQGTLYILKIQHRRDVYK